MFPACGMLAYLMPSYGEMLILLVVGLLLFGRDLPQVGKKVARTIMDLKRGVHQFRASLENDPDLRDATSTMHELRRELAEPGRALEAPFRQAIEGTIAAEPLLADPQSAFAGLTDEALATPGPDAAISPPPPAKSPFVAAAELAAAQDAAAPVAPVAPPPVLPDALVPPALPPPPGPPRPPATSS